MIEKIIHYVWLGSREVPREYAAFIENWRKLHPEWEIIKWNEENYDCENNDWIRLAIEQKNYSLAADVIRSNVLLNYGGVYLDVDIELFKPLDDLVNENDFFIGYETDFWFGCAILGAKKNHQIMREAYERYLAPCKEVNSKSNMLCVLNFSATIKRLYGAKLDGKTKKLEDNSCLLSSDYFFPQHYITHRTKITNNTVAKHHYSATWHSAGQLAGIKIARATRLVLGRRIFGCFERIARINMLYKLNKEYKARSKRHNGTGE
ncbi:MAG: hypothetical protein LBO63_00585 [Oscillospiraceae bacterium]|jgi:hypothetical protein|nr:hypothetical protein [Oscillospiraceae bacterium]